MRETQGGGQEPRVLLGTPNPEVRKGSGLRLPQHLWRSLALQGGARFGVV